MTELLPPSPFGAGTQYDGAGKHIVAPERPEISHPPRIARTIGERATETVVSIHDLQQPQRTDAYAGPASRQADLDRAEAANIQRAAVEAGMSVDRWKATRRQR